MTTTSEQTTNSREDELDFLDAMDLQTTAGAEAAEEKFKEQQVPFNRLESLRLEDDQSVIGRFLTDMRQRPGHPAGACPNVNQHYLKCKDKPADAKWWPSDGKMSAVCRKDKVFNGHFKDCYGCDVAGDQPWPRTWALIVLREEVLDEKTGAVLQIRTKMKEVAILGDDGKPIPGKTEMVPDIRYLNQAYSNFFQPVFGMSTRAGTILNRDFEIKRKKVGKKVEYNFEKLDPLPFEWRGPKGDQPVQVRDNWDLSDPEIFLAYFPDVPDLRRPIGRKASDRHYKYYFISGSDEATDDAPPPPNNDMDPEQAAALRAKLRDDVMKNYGANSGVAAL